jgi:hypothetical protein
MSQADQNSPYRIQTPHGIVELSIAAERVQNPGGSVSQIRHWTIRMSEDQSSAALPIAQTGWDADGQRLVNEQASWLKYEGDIGALEPRTVIIAQNETHSGAYIARWHGNDSPGSGQLTELLVPTSQGWRQVPPDVVNMVPAERITDAVRPNATSFDYIVPQDGSQPRWNASYLDADNQRVQLTFAANNELAVREVRSNDPSRGSIVTFGPGDDDLQRNGAIRVSEGSRLVREQGGATVINAAGDLRSLWSQTADGGYREERRIEHLYIDGRPSEWRVSTDLPENNATLYRVDRDNRQTGDAYPLTLGSDGRLVIPRNDQTAVLDGATLGIPSGTGIGTAAPVVDRTSPGVTTREVPLPGDATPYSIRETLEQKAGYSDPAQAPWARQRVELPRNIAENLDIPVPAGQNAVVTELELLPHSNARGRFSLRDGTELIGNRDSARDLFVIANMNEQTRGNAQIAATEVDGAFLVPSGGRPAHQVLAELADRGLEPVAVLGTGFITPEAGANGTKVIGYHYTNFSRLEEGREGRSDQGETELRDINNGTNLRAGYWVDARGEMHLLNFDRADPRYDTPTEVNTALERMKDDPNVVAIHLFTHRAADGVEDLIGNAPYDADRGETGWTPRPEGVTGGQYDTDPTNVTETRSLLVFDAQGDFVGRLSTPPISTRDTYGVAQEVYGDRAKYVLNGDGDFYARAWYLDGREASDPLALGYENAMILVRPTPDGQPAQLREFTDAERAAIRDYDKQEGIFDNLRDALKGAQRQLDDFGRGVGERTDQLREDAQRTIDGIREQIDNFRFPWEQSTNGDRSPAQPLAAEPPPLRTDQVAANAPNALSTSPPSTNAPSTNELSSIADSPAFRDVYAGIQQQDQRLGRTSDQYSLQLAAALTVEVERQRIAPPIQVAFDDTGTRAFAFEKNAARPEAQAYAHVDIAQAVHQPLAASEQRLAEARQLAAQTAPAESRGVDDPARSAARLA